MTAFRQVVGKLQEGQRQEALIGLEFVLRLDDRFAPASNLQKQLASGTQAVDLAAVIAGLQAPSTEQIDELLIEAVDDFNQRNFGAAKEKVDRVLIELPGHAEARRFRDQVEDALKQEQQVWQYLTKAREAVAAGDPQEGANFVMMAQTLDPHHPGIAAALAAIQAGVASTQPQPSPQTKATAPAARPVAAATAREAVPKPAKPSFEAPAAAPAQTPPPELDDALFSLDAEPPAVVEAQAETLPDQGFAFIADETAPADEFGIPSDVGDTADSFDFTTEAAASADEFGIPSDMTEPADASAIEGVAPAADFAFSIDEASSEVAEAPLFGGAGDDISELFVAEAASPLAAEVTAGEPGDQAADIAQLLAQGSVAFDQGELQQAIDIWSRIFLIDPSHPEASSRIEVARARLVELDGRLSAVLAQARQALDNGQTSRAQTLLDEVLALRPDHMEALELSQRIPPPAAAVAPILPDLDENLFGEEDLFAEAPAAADTTASLVRALERAPTAAPAKKMSPLMMGLIGVGAVAVILAGVFFARGLLARSSRDSDAEALTRILAQAEEYHRQGKTEEAIHLLEGFKVSELDRPRLESRLAIYREAVAPPAPTPVPQSLTTAQSLVATERWLAAYDEVQRGLAASPQDPGLTAVREQILRHEPLIASLYKALESSDYRNAVGLAEDLLRRHPESAEFAAALQRHLYNAAVDELQSFNLTGAQVHLERLVKMNPGDSEADRILRFVVKYKARPVDMQLRIFIGSLPHR